MRSKITILGAESPRYLCMKLQSSKGPSILSLPEDSTKILQSLPFGEEPLFLYIFINFVKLAITIIIKQIWRCRKGVFVCKIMNLLKSARYFLSLWHTAFPVSTQHQIPALHQSILHQPFVSFWGFDAPWLSPFQSFFGFVRCTVHHLFSILKKAISQRCELVVRTLLQI